MKPLEQKDLFRQAGPDEAIDYLWGRLLDRDLSQEEALALLGAVHRRLSTSEARVPKVYFAYCRFMESLSKDMPVVHDYVVAKWIESRRSAVKQAPALAATPAHLRNPSALLSRTDAVDAVDGNAAAGNTAVPSTGAAQAAQVIRPSIVAGSAEREPEAEPEEEDDQRSDPDRPPGGKPEEASDEDIADDEVEAVPGKIEEADPREDREDTEPTEDRAETDVVEEARDEGGADRGEEAAEPASEDAPEQEPADEPDAAQGEQAEAAEPANEASGPERGGGEEQNEWPVEETPEPAEPEQEFDGDFGEAPVPD